MRKHNQTLKSSQLSKQRGTKNDKICNQNDFAQKNKHNKAKEEKSLWGKERENEGREN